MLRALAFLFIAFNIVSNPAFNDLLKVMLVILIAYGFFNAPTKR